MAREHLSDGDPFFVFNSDVTCEYPLKELLDFHRKHGTCARCALRARLASFRALPSLSLRGVCGVCARARACPRTTHHAQRTAHNACRPPAARP
ncbi:hypothetical protein EON67_03005 [archaeon]|nr:MAG: hypothetical protein EON67_03005 [archaeon]